MPSVSIFAVWFWITLQSYGDFSGHLYNHVWGYTKSVMFFVLIRNEISQWIHNTKYLPNVCCQHICWNGLNWPMLRWSPRKRQPHKIRSQMRVLWTLSICILTRMSFYIYCHSATNLLLHQYLGKFEVTAEWLQISIFGKKDFQ